MRGRSMDYPIPPDGQVLRSSHLRGQTLFALIEAGRARRGIWGFFRPTQDGSGAAPNRIQVSNGQLVIHNLAVVSPDGFTLRAAETPPKSVWIGGKVRLAWKLPEHASNQDGRVGTDIEIVSAGDSRLNEPGAFVIGEIVAAENRGDIPQFAATAPALGLDAAESLAEAWEELGGALHSLADAVAKSPRGLPFERSLVRAALDGIRAIPKETEPRQAMKELKGALVRLADFIKAYEGGKGAVEETEGWCARVEDCRLDADKGLTLLCESLQRLAAADREEIVRWLEAEEPSPLELLRSYKHANMEERVYHPGDPPVSSVLIAAPKSGASGTIEVWFRLASPDPQPRYNARRKYEELPKSSRTPFDERAGDLREVEVPTGAQEFHLRCRVDATIQVRGTGA